jgi:hypothetical protein
MITSVTISCVLHALDSRLCSGCFQYYAVHTIQYTSIAAYRQCALYAVQCIVLCAHCSAPHFHATASCSLLAHCRQIELTGVDLKLNTRVSAEELLSKDSAHSFDQVVLATGVLPRQVSFPGSDHPKVVTYVDVLRRNVSENYTCHMFL